MSSPSASSSRFRGLNTLEANLRKLRIRGPVDARVDDLEQLLSIARKLGRGDADRAKVEETVAKGIDACWGGTREGTPTVRDAVRLWFGLSAVDDRTAPDLRKMRSAERQRAAWEYLESHRISRGDDPREKLETFRSSKATARYEALARTLLALAAEAEALEDPLHTDPPDVDSTSQPRDEPPAADASRSGHQPHVVTRRITVGLRSPRALAATLTIASALAAGLIAWLSHPASRPFASPRSVPPREAIVNAETGKVEFGVQAKPEVSSGSLAGGQVLAACVISKQQQCSYASMVQAEVGSIVELDMMLFNGTTVPVHYVKLTSRSLPHVRTKDGIKSIRVDVSAISPPVLHTSNLGNVLKSDSVYVKFARPGAYYLSYIPNSTRLFGPEGRLVHYLPNGIMQYGVALQDVGPPASCFLCNKQYERYVNFRLKVMTK
jgi:hypothetical protein